MATLRIATRRSNLALWQAEHVAARLRAADPGLAVELVPVSTLGDRAQDRPIWELAGAGVFVKEVQAAVLDGRADVAVHSAKDLPSSPDLQPEALTIGAVPERGDPRDALAGTALSDIPPGGRVATGSTRRRAQLADLRPDLTFTGLRGSIETRLAQARHHAAVVVAAAALHRLGRETAIAEVLSVDRVIPQVGQGALAVECRADDDATRARLAAIEHGPSRLAVDAERGFLASLGGGCELPAGAYAEVGADGSVRLRAVLASLDGRVVLRVERRGGPGDDAADLGQELGGELLDGGGRWLLDAAAPVPR